MLCRTRSFQSFSTRWRTHRHQRARHEKGLKRSHLAGEAHSFACSRCSAVFTTTYSLNISGSNTVTISLDPNLDFCPFLQLHKPGLDGVCLSSTTWQELMSVKGYISSFYKGELSRDRMQDILLLGPMEKIMFKFQYN